MRKDQLDLSRFKPWLEGKGYAILPPSPNPHELIRYVDRFGQTSVIYFRANGNLTPVGSAKMDLDEWRESPESKPDKIIYIVMSNDFPADVAFTSEEDARAYCDRRRKEDNTDERKPAVYWRYYPAVLRSSL